MARSVAYDKNNEQHGRMRCNPVSWIVDDVTRPSNELIVSNRLRFQALASILAMLVWKFYCSRQLEDYFQVDLRWGSIAQSSNPPKFAFEPFKLFGTRPLVSWQIRHNFGAWKIARSRFPDLKIVKVPLDPEITGKPILSQVDSLLEALVSKQNNIWISTASATAFIRPSKQFRM